MSAPNAASASRKTGMDGMDGMDGHDYGQGQGQGLVRCVVTGRGGSGETLVVGVDASYCLAMWGGRDCYGVVQLLSVLFPC